MKRPDYIGILDNRIVLSVIIGSIVLNYSSDIDAQSDPISTAFDMGYKAGCSAAGGHVIKSEDGNADCFVTSREGGSATAGGIGSSKSDRLTKWFATTSNGDVAIGGSDNPSSNGYPLPQELKFSNISGGTTTYNEIFNSINKGQDIYVDGYAFEGDKVFRGKAKLMIESGNLIVPKWAPSNEVNWKALSKPFDAGVMNSIESLKALGTTQGAIIEGINGGGG